MENGGDVAPFVRAARHLAALGISTPEIFRVGPAEGTLVMEDLGDASLARIAKRQPEREAALYTAATDLLVALHAHPPPAWASRYGPAEMAAALAPAWEHYARPRPTAGRAEAAAALLRDLLDRHAPDTSVLLHRDFHAENLIWLPRRAGLARIGVLDMQDALAGHPAYDLASLLQDARRAIAPGLERALIDRYVAATGRDRQAFEAAYILQAIQRHTRILGIFARLARQGGKPGYLRLMPRVWGHLLRNLDHPVTAPLRPALLDLLPAPDAAPA